MRSPDKNFILYYYSLFIRLFFKFNLLIILFFIIFFIIFFVIYFLQDFIDPFFILTYFYLCVICTLSYCNFKYLPMLKKALLIFFILYFFLVFLFFWFKPISFWYYTSYNINPYYQFYLDEEYSFFYGDILSYDTRLHTKRELIFWVTMWLFYLSEVVSNDRPVTPMEKYLDDCLLEFFNRGDNIDFPLKKKTKDNIQDVICLPPGPEEKTKGK